MKTNHLVILVLLLGLAVPAGAFAAGDKGDMRLSLETPFIYLAAGNYEVGNSNPTKLRNHDFEIGLGQGVLIGFGIAVIDRLLIGGRLVLDYYHGRQSSSHYSTFSWGILPYGEYIFLDGKFKPFVTVTLGIEGAAEGENDDTWEMDFYFAGGGGFHFYIIDQLSLDATFLLGARFGGGDWDNGSGEDDLDIHQFRMSILMGLSAWF